VTNSYRGADKSLARPGRKQARKHVRGARDFNNIETRAIINFFFPLQGKAPKEIQAILKETLARFLPGRNKDLSAPLYNINQLDAIISQIYFWNKILHVSDSSSVHHQEFFTVKSVMVYVIQVC